MCCSQGGGGGGPEQGGGLSDAAAAGYLIPLRAHDWDKACLLMFRSFGTSWEVPEYDQLQMPILVVQVRLGWGVVSGCYDGEFGFWWV